MATDGDSKNSNIRIDGGSPIAIAVNNITTQQSFELALRSRCWVARSGRFDRADTQRRAAGLAAYSGPRSCLQNFFRFAKPDEYRIKLGLGSVIGLRRLA